MDMLFHCFLASHVRHEICLTGKDHPLDHIMTSDYTPRHAQVLHLLLEPRARTMHISSLVQSSKDHDICMDMLSHCLLVLYEAWNTSDMEGSARWCLHAPAITPDGSEFDCNRIASEHGYSGCWGWCESNNCFLAVEHTSYRSQMDDTTP